MAFDLLNGGLLDRETEGSFDKDDKKCWSTRVEPVCVNSTPLVLSHLEQVVQSPVALIHMWQIPRKVHRKRRSCCYLKKNKIPCASESEGTELNTQMNLLYDKKREKMKIMLQIKRD